MIPRRSPLRRTAWPRNRAPRENRPGSLYEFTYKGKSYALPGRWLVDPEAHDGKRWIAAPQAKPLIRQIVRELADGRCEMHLNAQCWRWTPINAGHAHHGKHCKMGGAHTDDRIWNEAGERLRFWVCPSCHRRHHNALHWSKEA